MVVAHRRLDADLSERAPVGVSKKKVPLVVIGDENIDEAVIVIVSNGGAHALADLPGDSGLGRDIGKCSVMIVAEEIIREPMVKRRRTRKPFAFLSANL